MSIVAAAALFSSVTAMLIHERNSLKEQSKHNLISLTNVAVLNSTAPLAFVDQTAAKEMLAALSVRKNIIAAIIYDASGDIFASYKADPFDESSIKLKHGYTGSDEDDTHIYVKRPVILDGEKIGSLLLVEDQKGLFERLSNLYYYVGAVALFTFLIILVLSFVMQKIFSKPLYELVNTMIHVANTKDYAVRVKKLSNNEMGVLIDCFNSMLTKIGKQKEELDSYNSDLEDRISERTEYISKTNIKLKSTVNSLEVAIEAAEASSKLKSQFLANMSHEIRTPMNGIVGMTDLLQRTNLEDKQTQYVKTIHSSGQTLLSIINEILDFSKIESGQLFLEKIEFSLPELLADTCTLFSAQAQLKEIKLVCNISDSVSTNYVGDPTRLQQILTNLVGNAIKFTESGEVIIGVSAQRNNSRDKVSTLEFYVYDTGIGVPEDKLLTIFESFSQADGSTTRKFGGSGLGLTISSHLVQLFGGNISVESEVGKGSTFHFSVTLENSKSIEDKSAIKFDRSRVLVVDDNATNRRIFSHQLRNWNLRVDTAENADQAITLLHKAHAENNQYQIALLDQLMPIMTGTELAQKIADDPAIQGVRLAMLSSAASPDPKMTGTNFSCILQKPMLPALLKRCIEQLLGESKVEPDKHLEYKQGLSLATTFSANILVAEDNLVNQIVVESILSELGCSVDIADNGKLAFETWKKGDYDIVLMDVQMPVMDGCDATAAIRDWEKKADDDSYQTIIALTANAMEGDRERFITAGMDDYLTKPFNQTDMIKLLSRWLTPITGVDIERPVNSHEPPRRNTQLNRPTGLDMGVLNELREWYKGEKAARFVTLVRAYLDGSSKQLAQLKISIEKRDAQSIHLAAHTMKSSSAFLGAIALSKHYEQLEQAAKRKDLSNAEKLYGHISYESERVESELYSLVDLPAVDHDDFSSAQPSGDLKLQLGSTDDGDVLEQYHILVVDDDQTTRDIARVILEDQGYCVTEAINGREGVEKTKQVQPDIILMDVEMPIMNGYEACRVIKSDLANNHIPVVMATGRIDKESVEQCYASGAANFESKPMNWSELLPRLKFILRAAQNVEKLEVSEQRLNNAQQLGGIGHWDWNVNSGELYFSDHLYTILGMNRKSSKIDLKSLMPLLDRQNRRDFYTNMKHAINSRAVFSFDHVVTTPNGRTCTIHQEGEAYYDKDGNPTTVHGVVQDVTDRRQAEMIIKHHAYHDSLTGLCNRKSFDEQLELALAISKRQGFSVAVMYLDIDGFKLINDSLGHHVGDALLKEISVLLVETIRESDLVSRGSDRKSDKFGTINTSVARLGGDEFTVMLTGVNNDKNVELVAQKICNALSKPLKLIVDSSTFELHVTASIGISLSSNTLYDGAILQRNADSAMYAAKLAGKNTYRFYTDSMDKKSSSRLDMENKLRNALENNELELHYQPQLSLHTGEVVGMEALLRWVSPELGSVSPTEFIPLAEERGLIGPITTWVLETACRQNKAWQNAGLPHVTVAVNLSGVQFHQHSLLNSVRSIVERSGLSPEYLDLELTEGTLISHSSEAISTLDAFRKMGIKTSIDDFGTGYSSLNYLRRFPLDNLKIDRSFVKDIGSNLDNEAIISAIIAMAHRLKLRVIAEGVENEYQLEFLKNQDCDFYQGHLFSPAIPAHKMAKLLVPNNKHCA